MSEYLERLEKRIRMLKNSIQGQNDWRTIKFEIQKRGGKWVAENGMTYILKDNAIYAYTKESGISNVLIMAYEAPIPYMAELTIDMQFVQPENRNKILEELNKEILKKPKAGPQIEIITIVDKDWLSKISLKRWGTIHWKNHLEPTQATLNSPKRMGRPFNTDGDLIYPGDTFIVK
jgi:hypothetical protein